MKILGETPAAWADAALNFAFPEACQVCGERRAPPAEGFVCEICRREVRPIRPPFCGRCGLPFQGDLSTEFECANCREMELRFSFARSAVVAGGVVLEVIHRFKYLQARWFEPFLAGLLIEAAGPELVRGGWDFLVPVPLHPVKERERGFNQAACLAARLGAATGIPLNENLLRRIQPTRTQTLLTREERAANVRRAFAVRPGASLEGERLVLVDDVFTTGATTSAAAGALLAAGAGEVCVWTAARGL
jgi:competence protein ComFC